MSDFDFDQVFDEDYLFFDETWLTPTLNVEDAAAIWSLLRLAAGDAVLDAPCGHGRISNQLARAGAIVTGLDATELFLERARRDAKDLGVAVDYQQGDLRAMPWAEQFDVVINWFTSFGYFDEEGNRSVLEGMYNALRPGGRLLIDHRNVHRLLRDFQGIGVAEREGRYLIDHMKYDPLSGYTETERTIVGGADRRQMHYRVREFTFTELRGWLHQAGFEYVRAFDRDGQPFSLTSRRMVVIARKPLH